MGWGMPQTTRLLPVYTLVLPTAVMGVSQYIIIQAARATMLSTFRQREQEMRVRKSRGLFAFRRNPKFQKLQDIVF